MIFRIYTDATWVSHEPGMEGAYSYEGMRALYREGVNKEVYPCFEAWLWDMERRSMFRRHVMR